MANVTKMKIGTNVLNIADTFARETGKTNAIAIADLKTKIDSNIFDRVIIIGDSFSGDWYEGFDSWYHTFAKRAKPKYIKSYSFGGSGFIATGLESKNFADAWTDVIVQGEGTDLKDTTLVIVQGGLNDYDQDYTAEKNATSRLLTKIAESCPSATIVGFIHSALVKPYHSTYGGISAAFAQAGCAFTTNAWLWVLGQSYLFGNDSTHPNALGMKYLGDAFYNWFRFGVDIPEYYSGFWGGLGGGIIWRLTSAGLSFHAYGSSTSTENNQTITTINKYFAPGNYIAIPAYSDGGMSTYLTIATDGETSIVKFGGDNNQMGKWRFDGIIPLDML